MLPFFEKESADQRPRNAITIARAWVRGEVRVGDAQKAAVRAHAGAREVATPTAIAAARAAGHAVATAHAADHCLGASIYALKAVKAAGGSVDAELAWQLKTLPKGVRTLVTSALKKRLPGELRAVRWPRAVRQNAPA